MKFIAYDNSTYVCKYYGSSHISTIEGIVDSNSLWCVLHSVLKYAVMCSNLTHSTLRHTPPLPPPSFSCPVCCMCRTHWRSRHESSLTPTHCLRMGRWLWARAPSPRTGSGLHMSSARVGRTGEQCRWSVCTLPHSHPPVPMHP